MTSDPMVGAWRPESSAVRRSRKRRTPASRGHSLRAARGVTAPGLGQQGRGLHVVANSVPTGEAATDHRTSGRPSDRSGWREARACSRAERRRRQDDRHHDEGDHVGRADVDQRLPSAVETSRANDQRGHQPHRRRQSRSAGTPEHDHAQHFSTDAPSAMRMPILARPLADGVGHRTPWILIAASSSGDEAPQHSSSEAAMRGAQSDLDRRSVRA